MNKQQFMEEFKRELVRNGVKDPEEILEDYEEHFRWKQAEGKTEAEICRRLGTPAELAAEYAEAEHAPVAPGKRAVTRSGVVGLGILFFCVDALMWAAVLAVMGFCLALLVLGICLLTTWNPGAILPEMPYWTAICLSVSAFGLAALSGTGTIVLWRYVQRFTTVFVRWSRKIWRGDLQPSATLHPRFSPRVSAILRLVAVIGTLCFVGSFLLAYILMCLSTGSLEPWHVWNWFMK